MLFNGKCTHAWLKDMTHHHLMSGECREFEDVLNDRKECVLSCRAGNLRCDTTSRTRKLNTICLSPSLGSSSGSYISSEIVSLALAPTSET